MIKAWLGYWIMWAACHNTHDTPVEVTLHQIPGNCRQLNLTSLVVPSLLVVGIATRGLQRSICTSSAGDHLGGNHFLYPSHHDAFLAPDEALDLGW